MSLLCEFNYYNQSNINEYINNANKIVKNILIELKPDFDTDNCEDSIFNLIQIAQELILSKMFFSEKDINAYYALEVIEKDMARAYKVMQKREKFSIAVYEKGIYYKDTHMYEYSDLVMHERLIRQSHARK